MVRPAAGVWLRVASRPCPPRLAGVFFFFAVVVVAFRDAAGFLAAVFLDADLRTGLRLLFAEAFRAVLRLAVFLAGAFRVGRLLARDDDFLVFRAFAVDFRAVDRPLAVDFALVALRFFAGVLLLAFLRVVFAMCASERSGVEFDRWPLSVVSSSAYLTCR